MNGVTPQHIKRKKRPSNVNHTLQPALVLKYLTWPQKKTWQISTLTLNWAIQANFLLHAAFIQACTALACGQCVSMPDLVLQRNPTNATIIYFRKGRPGFL